MIIEKNNKGIVFSNTYATSQKHPKWKGNAQVDGKQYHVSIWEGKTTKGDPKLSIDFQTEEEAAKWKNQDPDSNQKYESVKKDPFANSQQFTDDDVPF